MADHTLSLTPALDQALLRVVAQLNQRRAPNDPPILPSDVLLRWVTPYLAEVLLARRERNKEAVGNAIEDAAPQQKAAALDAIGYTVVNGEIVRK